MSPREFTILVAGREELSRAMESALVERRRFSVVRAESAAEAVTLAGARALDLALLCDEPPENPGAALCGRLKQDRALAKLPVLIAGVRDGSAVEDAERNGAAAVLPASATMDRVLEAVSTLLGIPVRRPVRVAVVFNLEKDGTRETLGRAVNLSVAGMALEVNRPYPPNTLLRFRFTLPGERERMEGEAAVRWTRAQGNDAYAIGVEFVTLSGAHRKRVKSFIERTESPA